MTSQVKGLPCGHWDKDWSYDWVRIDGKDRKVMTKATCRDCGIEVKPI